MTRIIANNRNATVISDELGYRPSNSIINPPPTEDWNNGVSPISCLWGTPFWDGTTWKCPTQPTAPMPPLLIPPRTIVDTPVTTTPPAQTGIVPLTKPVAPSDGDGTIFGFQPLTLGIIAAVGIGLYMMSQMGGEGERKKR